MNITEIRKLIRLVESSSVTEIEVTEGESSVRISCQPAVAQQAVVTQAAAPIAPVAAPALPVNSPVAEPEATLDEHEVTSPMVGTFYSAPSPDADDFVVEGQKVKKGDTLCIIEAMKLMNEIESEYNGVVEKILVQNATPLEFGQAMFVVTPA